jgi:hypothetical protein
MERHTGCVGANAAPQQRSRTFPNCLKNVSVRTLVELVGIELLRGVENTRVIDFTGGENDEKGTIAG